MKDRDVINAFVAYLQENGHPGLEVERWPDDESPGDIDAIAGPFAIEHTSIDTLPNQRRDTDLFAQVVGGLKEELSGSIPFRLIITLDYHAVKKGQNWSAIRNALKTWIITDALLLRDGNHILDSIRGVPFRLHIAKDSSRRPCLHFGRYNPGDDTTLSDRFRQLVVRKAKKLLKYKDTGKTKLLLVANDDLSLMDESKMLVAIREAFSVGLPNGVDQLWYADTSIPSEILFRDFTRYLE